MGAAPAGRSSGPRDRVCQLTSFGVYERRLEALAGGGGNGCGVGAGGITGTGRL
jgi:hypothetical protein